MKGILIRKGEKYYTHLKKIFNLLDNIQVNYNWLITAHECYPYKTEHADILSGEWCWISGKELTEMIETDDFQWIWGVLSAFPPDVKKEDVLQYQLPTADNEEIWKNPVSIQHPLAVLEIIAWDSTLTVIISNEDDVVEKIRKSNPLIEDLEEYNNRCQL